MENEQIKPIPPVQPSSSPAQSSPSSGSTVASPSTSPSAQAVNTTPAQVVPTSPIKTKVRLRMPSNFPWLKVAGAILLVILALLAWVSLVDVSVSSNPQADEILINGKPANKTSFVRMPGSFT
ncbi:hypothetical protein KBB60_02055, partial [Patescibacteria group bacterium]|nr:hypothetical protein [Patescibacteria group bacterium]